MGTWFNNRSIGPTGVKIIIVVFTAGGILGTAFGIKLLFDKEYDAAYWVIVLSLVFGISVSYTFAKGFKTNTFFHRQMSYICRTDPIPFDDVNNFVNNFLVRSNIDFTYDETSSGSNYHTTDDKLRAFVLREGQNAILFGINDKYGGREQVLNAFYYDAIGTLKLNNDTEDLSISEFPKMATSSTSNSSNKNQPALLLEEPVEFFLQRVKSVGYTGSAMIVLGFLFLSFGIIGRLTSLAFNSYCITGFIIAGPTIIAVGYIIQQIPNNSRPIKIYETGMLESFPPQKTGLDPKTTFYIFSNLKQIKDNRIPTHPCYHFIFTNPSRTIILSQNIPGMANLIEYIQKNYPQTKFV